MLKKQLEKVMEIAGKIVENKEKYSKVELAKIGK
ncbi:MAG: hypothetical protein ACI9XO_000767 [Paraglaciecola sp.]|jgi:hypothetical protein